LVRTIGERASASEPADAFAFGEAILLAVPLHAVPELGREHAATAQGKVIIDPTNPYPGRDGEAARAVIGAGEGSSRWAASHFPGARVVKAFNTVYFGVLAAQAHKPNDPLGIPLAGDDKDALEIVASLVRDAGFEPVLAGSLADGAKLDPGSPNINTSMGAADRRRALQAEA
jgi:predicted dinucleotide-binding enzyme